ncbi:MAG: hypothetical protein DME04_00525 [Candidatus Rokuibacteriota bacterium]|nr:MAG: hypothetical protein DME04_00525 [Candidatus Rokubacteria bacterium]
MRAKLGALLALTTLIAQGCASAPAPPKQVDRGSAIRRALEPCERQYPAVRVLGIDDQGQLHAQATPAHAADLGRFQICAQEAIRRQFDVQFSAGQLSAPARSTTVPLRLAGTLSLVSVVVNGVTASLLLDTGATLTVLRPAFARRASIDVLADAPKMSSVVVGGQRYEVPLVRVRSLAVGDVTVEGIDVGVIETLGNLPGVDGLLGGNFLSHFKVTIDRTGQRLTFEPSRPSQPTATAPAPKTVAMSDREWQLPVWSPGDEWRTSWKTPTASGTAVLTVEGEETVDGIEYYVIRNGARQVYYVKSTLGWHMEKVNGAVVLRRTPPIAHDWPLRVGKSWDVRYQRQDGDGRTSEFYRRCLAADETPLSVAAGTFLTLHLVCRDVDDRVVSEVWYAAEVKGAVRERIVSSQGDRIEELVSYTVRPAQ